MPFNTKEFPGRRFDTPDEYKEALKIQENLRQGIKRTNGIAILLGKYLILESKN
jgi:hypothetical protein